MASLDQSKIVRPDSLSSPELAAKLAHMASVLDRAGTDGVLLIQEGALRWLTGIRHQIIDIAPASPSPVQAFVLRAGSRWNFTFITTRIEMPRLKDQIPFVYGETSDVSFDFAENLPATHANVLFPGESNYALVVEEIVRPIVGGLDGDQFAKLDWLSCMTAAVLAETAHSLEPGMDGAHVRGLLFHNLARQDVESNLIMVALAEQESHFHPLYNSKYRLKKHGWFKLVVGTRYADMIDSATVMGKFGGVPEDIRSMYGALQQAVIEYADCYTAGAIEADLFRAVGERFRRAGEHSKKPEIARSAYAHHLGGPTSPLGNRDYLIEKDGARRMFPWMQFAVNPVEIAYGLKVEVQGVVLPEGPPHMLDPSRFTPSELQRFRRVEASGGTAAMVPGIIEL